MLPYCAIVRGNYKINGISVGNLYPDTEYLIVQKQQVDQLNAKLEAAKKALEAANQYFIDRGGLGYKGASVEELVSAALKEII